MKFKTGILTIILVFGLLGVPNCIFAQESISSDAVLQSNIVPTMQLNSLNPEMKGGGGRGGSSSSSKSSASKAVKKLDGDDDDTSDDGSGGGSWLTVIIILVVLFGIIGFLVWFFLLRK
ncbi:hypothetical protein [Methanobacterium sp. ACI-7]|uniref:hypothetical protein n=1 Tax=unclassified Methanobacterium TaxID=2627676 RepID=UPI0039C222A2